MEVSAKNDLKGLNFMEIGAIALYKEYENNGNEISGGILNESIMLNYSNASSKLKDPCC